MLCPRCKILLRSIAEVKNQPSCWECGSCRGRAVEDGRGVLDDVRLGKWLWELAKDSNPSINTRCPQCNRFMHPAVLESHQGPVEVDGCLSCKCIWFDKGEIESLNEKSFKGKDEEESQENIEDVSLIEDPIAFVEAVIAIPVPDKEFVWNDTVSWTVCAIALASVLCFRHLEWAVLHLGFIPATVAHHRQYTWISSFFVHADWGHLIGNLYFLFIVGAAIEESISVDGFLFLLFISTFGGNLAVFLLDPARAVPHIGASGGISGLMAYYSLKFPNKRISIAHFFGWKVIRFHIPVWFAFVLFLIVQIVGFARGMTGHVSNISFLAHLGGCATGVLYYLLF